MANKDLTLRMVDFSNVKDAATISFLSPKGELKSVFIHRDTFRKLMTGALEKEPSMSPSLDQIELRETINREIGKDPIGWFNKEANEISRKEANARSTY